MGHKKPLIIANWKLNKSYAESVAWSEQHGPELAQLAEQATIVICPTFPALAPLSQLFKNSSINLGAQTCSSYLQGNITGDVSVPSLQEIGCRYTLVGHSERRRLYHEMDGEIIEKVKLLLAYDLTPVLCIGETDRTASFANITDHLEQQLQGLMQLPPATASLVIAYEPVWAIGTQETPSPAQIEKIAAWIREYTMQRVPTYTIQVVYGGSVQPHSADIFQIPSIEGVLLGGASLDFKNFKNAVRLIVESYT